MTTRKVGYVMVDSGMVVLGDPAYVMEDEQWGEIYDNLEWKQVEPPPFWPEGEPYTGRMIGAFDPQQVEPGIIVSRTYLGDGAYPVYAEYADEGNLLSLTIRFDEDEDVDDDKDA